MPTLSIIVPMYNEEEALDGFFKRVQRVLQTVTPSYEIICVNDGSRDLTLARLRQVAERDERIKVVNLSRNFGKEIALSAGLDHAAGDAVIPIDADLQDPPEVIPLMVAKWRAGAKLVLAKRRDRSTDGWLKRLTASGAYWLFSKLTHPQIPQNVGDFRL
ncbi:MAG: glycosyltransferase family 2 protein, partial [Alphaproteobacteria bacterium]|nr:glycosyltransferase family 2 protein [Alphaproteobacteria bacterium]